MYLFSVIFLMSVLPLGSIAYESAVLHSGLPLMGLIGKWFVFWSVGMRLFIAGLRQVIQPSFTAQTIFDLKENAALAVVQELGFANVSIGLVGVLSLLNPSWTLPAAITGGLFYGLAGVRHLFGGSHSRLEVIAMISDLSMGAVLAVFVAASFKVIPGL